jgi:hypothetical protein
MALWARDNRISRRSLLIAGLATSLFRAQSTENLSVSFDGDNLHVTAPGLHFLTGKALSRLKDADTVTFVSQFTLYSDDRGTVFRRVAERMVVSYDLWEERFAVTLPASKQRVSHLTATQAENWAIENLAVSALGLAPDRPFWLRFELRTASQKELARVVGESGISLSGLVEIFSRKSGADDPYWMRSAGPLRLSDLPRTVARGPRIIG